MSTAMTEGKSFDDPHPKHPIAPIPEGCHSVSPWIVNRGVGELIDFMKAAFGAEERGRVMMGDTIAHAEVKVGDSTILLFDSQPDWPEIPALLRLYVEDGDAVFERALAAGAKVVTEMAELSFGDRVGRLRDPKGNLWWIQTHVKDVTPEQLEHPTHAQLDAMQEAMTTLDRELKSRRNS
jgi:uncharacterized glyoxalase superfamily protein PhnB